MTPGIAGYREIRVLGTGSQSRVTLARHEAGSAYVAIKHLPATLFSSPAEASRFRAEAQMLAQLDHPNIARLFDYVVTGDGAAILMEFVDGRTLRAILDAWRSRLSPEAALVMLKGSLLGLAAAHAHGFIHRDYKPANVMVQPDGSSKLIDFGLAAFSGDATCSGTPAYMAPEQWRGEPATPSTDVYAATCVFYECLTGQRPYRTSTIQRGTIALRRQHLTAPIPVAEIPPPLRRLVRSGMAKRPRDRPANAAVFLRELEETAVKTYGLTWERVGKDALIATVAGGLTALTISHRLMAALHTVKKTLSRILHIKTAAFIAGAIATTATTVYVAKTLPPKTYTYAYGQSHLLTKPEIDAVADLRNQTPTGKDSEYLGACDWKRVPLASYRHPQHRTYSLTFTTPTPQTLILPFNYTAQYFYQETVIVYTSKKQEAADFAALKTVTCAQPTTANSGHMNGWEYYSRHQTIPCPKTNNTAPAMCTAYYDYFTKANIILAAAWQQSPEDTYDAQETMDRLDNLLLAKFNIT